MPTGIHLPIMEELPADFNTVRSCITIMLLLLMCEQVSIPNHGIHDETEYVKSTIKETQQNSYTIDPVRRRKVKY